MKDSISSIGTIGAELDRRYEQVSAEAPFAPTSSIFHFFGGGGRAAVLDAIGASVNSGEVSIRVCGEPGSGKTMLASVLAEHCSTSHHVVRYEDDELSHAKILRQLLIEFCPRQLHMPSFGDKALDLRTTEYSRHVVVQQLSQGTPGQRPVLLLIDSPGALRPPVMRLLQELGEIRHDGKPVVQIVLFEPVEHDFVIAASAQPDGVRSSTIHHLWRLTLAEIGQYLEHQMLLQDYNKRGIFTREMVYFIADRSEGVFSVINAIARSAFTIARLERSDRPSLSHLLMAGLPQRDEPMPRKGFVARHRKAVFALLGSTVVASAATLVFLSVG